MQLSCLFMPTAKRMNLLFKLYNTYQTIIGNNCHSAAKISLSSLLKAEYVFLYLEQRRRKESISLFESWGKYYKLCLGIQCLIFVLFCFFFGFEFNFYPKFHFRLKLKKKVYHNSGSMVEVIYLIRENHLWVSQFKKFVLKEKCV